MDKRPERVSDEILGELTALRESQRSVILATVDSAGYPEASYAPYVCDERDAFYILVSQLACHTRNLEANCKASLLFIEPEDSTRQIFARRRLTYRCEGEPIARDTPQWVAQLAVMQRRFGAVVDQLGRLADFRLFRLVPLEGRYVRGFGQAFQWRRAKHAGWIPIGADDRR
ncbi:MAG: pyridoxamine 5'-phosphate oxidase family protein [Nitrococcus mobilis]|nr:pyridoxamine 5'-phosphate oxidase family protein [Nitrococcus mobilis]